MENEKSSTPKLKSLRFAYTANWILLILINLLLHTTSIHAQNINCGGCTFEIEGYTAKCGPSGQTYQYYIISDLPNGTNTYNWVLSGPGSGFISTHNANYSVVEIFWNDNLQSYIDVTISGNPNCNGTTAHICIAPPQAIPLNYLDACNPSSSTMPGAIYDPNGNYYNANNQIFIQGTFSVNYPYRFDDCDIIMAPGASIVINPGMSLKLNNTTIHGGQRMWEGIKLFNNSSITMAALPGLQTSIKDAYHAVDIIGQNIIFNSIGNVVLQRNYVGVHSRPCANKHIKTSPDGFK